MEKKYPHLKLLFLGDSITEGAWATEPRFNYVSRVGEMLGCTTVNYGLSGTRIARQKTPSSDPAFDRDFLSRAAEMGDGDMVFVFGGTNDYGHGDSEIGEAGSRDSYTFRGAVRNLAEALAARYGAENVCFILPLPRYDEDNPRGEAGLQTKLRPSLKVYVAAETAVLQEMGIPYLDLRGVFPCPETAAPAGYFQDGLHPNNEGHRLLAEHICAYVRQKMR